MVVMSFMGQGFSQMMMKMIATRRISSGQTFSCFIRMFANVRSGGEGSPTASCKRGVDCGFDLGDAEGVPADLRQGFRVDQELVAQHGLELAHVHFGNEDMFEPLQ